MKFELMSEFKESILKGWIEQCQEKGHIQQVAFSTYHNCLTQICFTCQKIRTSMKEDDYIIFKDTEVAKNVPSNEEALKEFREKTETTSDKIKEELDKDYANPCQDTKSKEGEKNGI